jgi:hypothetical protein
MPVYPHRIMDPSLFIHLVSTLPPLTFSDQVTYIIISEHP